MYSGVVITVPHAGCPSTSLDAPRECDRTAERMADLLHSALPGSALLKNTTTLRADVDMNRAESRRTEFRQKIDAVLTRDTVLVDVHSFDHDSFGGVHIVIMEARRSSPSADIAALLSVIRRRLPHAEVLWLEAHPTVNDIEYTAVTERGVALAFLLEVNEELNNQELGVVAEAFREWFAAPVSIRCEQCGAASVHRSLALCGASVCSVACRDAQLVGDERHRLVASYTLLSRGIVSYVHRYWIDEYGMLHTQPSGRAADNKERIFPLADSERAKLTRLRTKYGAVLIEGSHGGCTTGEKPWIALRNSADKPRELTAGPEVREIEEFFDAVLSARSLRNAGIW